MKEERASMEGNCGREQRRSAKEGGGTNRVDDVSCWDDSRVEEETEELDNSVDVEEESDFLSAWGRRKGGREGEEEEGASGELQRKTA